MTAHRFAIDIPASDRRSARRRRGRLTVLTTLVALAAPVFGQTPVSPAAGSELLAGIRLGGATAVDGSDHFDRLWGDPYPLAGVELELGFRRTFLRLTLERSEASEGDLTVELPRLFEPGGDLLEVEPRFAARTAHLTWGARLPSRSRWQPFVGAGITALAWEDTNDLRVLEDTDLGPHLLAGVAASRGRWSLSAALRYSRILGMRFDTSGKLATFQEQNLGLLAAELSARYRVWEDLADRSLASTEERLGVYVIGAWFHPTYRHTRLAADWILRSQQDDAAGYGLGARIRLGGPFTLAIAGLEAELDSSSTQTVQTPDGSTTLRAEGAVDVAARYAALEIDLWRRERLRLFGGPLIVDLSYDGTESGGYDIRIDRDGVNAGLRIGAELDLGGGGWSIVSTLEHLSVVRIDGFESGFELDPLVWTLGIGYRFGGRG